MQAEEFFAWWNANVETTIVTTNQGIDVIKEEAQRSDLEAIINPDYIEMWGSSVIIAVVMDYTTEVLNSGIDAAASGTSDVRD